MKKTLSACHPERSEGPCSELWRVGTIEIHDGLGECCRGNQPVFRVRRNNRVILSAAKDLALSPINSIGDSFMALLRAARSQPVVNFDRTDPLQLRARSFAEFTLSAANGLRMTIAEGGC